MKPKLVPPPERHVRIKVASKVTGLTESAIRTKIARRVWREGREWVRGPDKRIYIDLDGYRKWVNRDETL